MNTLSSLLILAGKKLAEKADQQVHERINAQISADKIEKALIKANKEAQALVKH